MTLLKQITAQHGGAAGYLVKKSHVTGGGGPTQFVPITPWNFRSALALIGNKRFFPFGSFLMVLIAVC